MVVHAGHSLQNHCQCGLFNGDQAGMNIYFLATSLIQNKYNSSQCKLNKTRNN